MKVLEMNGLEYRVNEIKWDTISDNNKQLIISFDLHNKEVANKGKGLRKATRLGQIEDLIHFAIYIKRDLQEVADDKEILYKFFREGFRKSPKQNTKMKYINMIRKFYKWLTKNPEPPITIDFKGFQPAKTSVTAQMVLTRDDINKITNAFPDVQRKAGILMLFDTGMRPDEFLNLKRKDITNNSGQWYVDIVQGKTGTRTLPLILSASYVELWYNRFHPYKEYLDAPLWISRSNRSRGKQYQHRGLAYSGLFQWIKQSEKVLNKKMWAKLFRHSRLSDLSKSGMPEDMMRLFAGWAPGSRMPEVYLHTHQKDMINKLRKIENLPVEEEEKLSDIVPIICPRCQKENPHDVKYCIQCWMPLDTKVAIEDLMTMELLKSDFYKNLVANLKKLQKEGKKVPLETLDIKRLAGIYNEIKKIEAMSPKEKDAYQKAKEQKIIKELLEKT